MSKFTLNRQLSIAANYLEEHPELNISPEALMPLLRLLVAAQKPRPRSKSFKEQVDAMVAFMTGGENKNIVWPVAHLTKKFNLLDAKTINATLASKKGVGKNRQLIPERERDEHFRLIGLGRVVGWVFAPSGENEYLADLELDLINANEQKSIREAEAKRAKMAETFAEYGRPLGIAHNPKGLPERTQTVEEKAA